MASQFGIDYNIIVTIRLLSVASNYTLIC